MDENINFILDSIGDAESRKIVYGILALELRQISFQQEMGVLIDFSDFEQKKRLTEAYILHLVKEAMEVACTIPSAFNKYEKTIKVYSEEEFKKEMADVFLHFINLLNLHNISFVDILKTCSEVQANNFKKLLDRKNEESEYITINDETSIQ